MPEQSSSRGDQVTGARFTGAFETHLLRLGPKGLNLTAEIGTVPPEQLTRMTNAILLHDGEITARPGQTSFATGGTQHHSIRAFRDPQNSTLTRVWGTDTVLRLGASGALGQIDAGYSGRPLSLVPHRPPLSGDPWMFVGDTNRMRKVRADGLVVPIGLPAPTLAAAGVVDIEYRTTILRCGPEDGSDAPAWTGVAGSDLDGHASGIPLILNDDTAPPVDDTGIRIRTQDGAITKTYDSWAGIPKVVDLSIVTNVFDGVTTQVATDDDLLHLDLMMGAPQLTEEIRVYFVCSAVFDPTLLPGTTSLGNQDAYMKAFRRDDFIAFLARAEDQITAAETARVNHLREDDLNDRIINDSRDSVQTVVAASDPSRRTSKQSNAGAYQWFEFGAIGSPLRRGDFQRIGITEGRDWSTITGIIVYLRMAITTADRIAEIGIDDVYLTGGYGPDSSEPGAAAYDVRYTHYDPRSGAESNGSPEMASTAVVDSLRNDLVWSLPAPYGDAAIRQRFYRRGGSITDDWYFLGVNTSDGGLFVDTFSDDAILAAGTLPIDHYQPVPTVNDAGTTILGQPLPALFGPLDGMLLACGDPFRPGHLYFSNADQPDHWSATGNTEVCPPSEELMHGGIIGHQGFVFSRLRLYLIYPNLAGSAGVTVSPTQCRRGIASRWAFCTGPGGIYFAAQNEGIFVTQGGLEEEISRDIRPLFRGETVNGYAPVDWDAGTVIRLSCWQNYLYVLYQDTNASRQVLKYDLLEARWMVYTFGRALSVVQGEDEPTLLLGSLNAGTTYRHSGTSDAGTAIAVTLRGPSFSAQTRDEKLFGDQIVDADRATVAITVQNLLNEETITNPVQIISGGTGRQRYILDAFGETPQRARSIATEITWSSATAAPLIYQLGYAVTPQPEITERRVTNWDDLGHPDEKWVSGVTLDVDTGNLARTILVERDYNGARDTIATLTVQANGRHKLAFSWPAVPAQQLRLRPDDDCQFWVLYRCDWIALPEPPRIAAWDIHFENAWDQYYTGLDLYCDTFGATKSIEVRVDEAILSDPFTGLPFFSVLANGRRVVHLTFTAGRGHVFRFRALDQNVGLLYTHRWHLQEEPSEQANWNQNFTTYGSRADKYLKAIVFECDTFGANKSVRIEADGTLVETLSINASGRKVVQRALTAQALGRVWRMYPADGNPGRLYSAQPVFDEEPFQLDRWETQETNHGLPIWFSPLYAHVTLKTTAPVVLTLTIQINQTGTYQAIPYTIPATGGQKQRVWVPFRAFRGVLIKYTLTSADPFWLYREETTVVIQPWGAAQPITVQPFGNSGEDPTRSMVNAVAAAEASGGSAS